MTLRTMPEAAASLRMSVRWLQGQLMGGVTIHTYTLASESGASLRGAGLTEPSAEVAPQQWTRPSRRRAEREILERVRWTEQLKPIT